MGSYKKLVRDKIPEIIKKNNETPITRVLNDEEYLESGDVEELADLEEVLRAILDVKKISLEEFEEIRNKKVQKRGAFKERIYLEGVQEFEI